MVCVNKEFVRGRMLAGVDAVCSFIHALFVACSVQLTSLISKRFTAASTTTPNLLKTSMKYSSVTI
jgi:hypothetical protein